jgi:hypothetical protein
MTGADSADRRFGMLSSCRACELAISLQLIVVTICESPINSITNTNAVFSHKIVEIG